MPKHPLHSFAIGSYLVPPKDNCHFVGQDGILRPIGNRPSAGPDVTSRWPIANRPQVNNLPHTNEAQIFSPVWKLFAACIAMAGCSAKPNGVGIVNIQTLTGSL